MSGFPFGHLTLAEVAESEKLRARDWAGTLADSQYGRLRYLLARRQPPLYDMIPEAGDAA